MAARQAGMECARFEENTDAYEHQIGFPGGKYSDTINHNGRWNGKTTFSESALQIPLKRKKATMYFVCSMGDLFHKSVPFEWIDKVFNVMVCKAPQHTYQVLTKRPERMAEYMLRAKRDWELMWKGLYPDWPFKNVWLGTTAENQEMADKRIPHLLKCPAAKRFVSCEPMLGPVDLTKIVLKKSDATERGKPDVTFNPLIGWYDGVLDGRTKLDWVICGGESGPGARPMHPDWARSLRDQCKAAGVPFFMKQMSVKMCRKCRGDACTHLAGHKHVDILTKNIDMFPEDLRIREYPTN
jgi:protein gp37